MLTMLMRCSDNTPQVAVTIAHAVDVHGNMSYTGYPHMQSCILTYSNNYSDYSTTTSTADYRDPSKFLGSLQVSSFSIFKSL